MFPSIQTRKAPHAKNVSRLVALFIFLGGGAGLLAGQDAGDQVVAQSITLDRHCQQVSAAAARSIYCLGDQALVRLSSAGEELARYGDGVKRPGLLASSESRVAAIDRRGLRVFAASGKQLFFYGMLEDPVAMAFQGKYLYLVERRRLLRFDDTVSPEVVVEPGSGIKFSRFDFFGIGPAGYVYLAKKRGNEIEVLRPDHRSRYRLRLPEAKQIRGLAVDSSGQLYVLAVTRESRQQVFVYRGLQRRYEFAIEVGIKSNGLSVMSPDQAADATVVVHDRKAATVHQYEYRQLPAQVIGVKVNGRPEGVSLAWQASSEPYVTGYVLYATESAQGNYEKIGEVDKSWTEIQFDRKRYHSFRVAARSRSGLVGEISLPAVNHFEAGYQHYLNKRYADAANHFLNIAQPGSADISAYRYLVYSLLRLGRYEQALALTQQLRRRPDWSTQAVRLQVETLLHTYRYRQAEALISALLDRQPDNDENLSLCAELQQQLGNKKAAIGCLARLLQRDEDNTGYQLKLYSLLDQQRDREQRSALARVLQRKAMAFPDESLMVDLGQLHLETGNMKRAAAWFSRALKRNGTSLAARQGMASVYLQTGKLSQARAVALKMLVTDGQQVEGYNLLGKIAGQQGNHGEAVHVYRKALATAPANPQSLSGLAMSYRALLNYQQAQQTFSQLLRHQPGNRLVLIGLARLEQQAGQYERAMDNLLKVLHYHPVDREAELMLAGLHLEQGQLWLATRHAVAADKLSADETTSRLLSGLYFRQGHLAEASTHVRKLLKSNRNSIDLNLQLAEIQVRRGDPRGAQKTLERVLRLDRKNKPALEQLISVYREQDMIVSAVQAAKRLVRIDGQPRYRLLLNALLAEQSMQGKNKNATPIVLEKFKPGSRVTSALARGQEVELGQFVIRNRGKRALVDIEVKVFIADLPGVDMEQRIERLEPGKSHPVTVRMNVADHLSSIDQDQMLQLNLEVSWQPGRRHGLLERSWWLPIRGRNAIDWQAPASVQRFLARMDVPGSAGGLAGLVNSFARFQLLMPEQLQGQTGRQSLQLPAQTLQRRKGSHEELGLLFASMLLGMDLDLALVRTDDDFLLLVSDRKRWQDLMLPGVEEKLFYQYDGRSWIPLDLRDWSVDLQSMWQRGLVRIGKIEQPGPMILASAGSKPVFHFGQDDSAALAWLVSESTRELLSHVFNGADTGQLSEQEIVAWWRHHGHQEAVVWQREKRLFADRFDYDSAMIIAELKAGSGFPGAAAEYYRHAARLRPFDIESRQGLVEALEQAGQLAAVSRTRSLIRKLTKAEPFAP